MQETVLQASLAASYNYFQAVGHQQNMNRIKELAHKLQTGEYGIAFAGHFSAGKSRMINKLLGENLLPSSPIPTSANLVRVHKASEGDEYARVFFHREKPRKYLAPYDYDLLRSFCRNGDQIAEIELCRRELNLPEQVVIMDTPGIDSSDDAHRAATEAALHLADIVLYVMDYNHVQAELNLSFTRALTKAGKEVYLIVNQIDKHAESELSFDSFRQGLEKAFHDWGVTPAGFFYTSLKEPEHPQNQFTALHEMLLKKIADRQRLLAHSIKASLRKILQEYQQEEQQRTEAELQSAHAALAKLSEEQGLRLRQDYLRLTQELSELQTNWEEDFDADIQKILDNAYLMPTSTRDLAKAYLEACQPEFKVGLFTRGKKTLAELERRRQAFFADAAEKTQSQLAWHLKTYFTDFAKKHRLAAAELLSYIQNMNILPPEELLTAAMRSGARLTQDGSYVMNYTANFAEGTKKTAQQFAQEYKHKIQALLTAEKTERAAAIKAQLADLEKYHQAWAAIDDSQLLLHEQEESLRKLLETTELPPHWEAVFSWELPEEEIVAPISAAPNPVQPPQAAVQEQTAAASAPDDNNSSSPSEANAQSGKAALCHWAEKLRYGSQLIRHIPMLQQLAEELAERAERLEDRRFMVTLFGAFSAGKSSFANSLLGEALLPVSPNPTTAAINKICPVDENHPHGTVIVKLKSEAMLLADVNRALSAFGLSAASTFSALDAAAKALQDDSHDRQREKAFLRAFQAGYAAAVSHLGQELPQEMSAFGSYAAQEEKSCFVDWLEIYYDCALTRLGITLVDTPGADSINARHTNMSFNYIRQSDVVLFVTYYNHAFSRADREFLIQLGRVKDAFALDKMFFIVNAVDLAENEEEAAGVISYVADQLKKFGVRSPRMFGLSSQQILQEKLKGRTEGFEFETAFYRFVFEELTNIAVNAAAGEYELAAARVQELIALGQSNADEKTARCQQLLQCQKKSTELLARITCTDMQNRQQQELHELIYYVRQRVFLRYTDFYREAFNPAVFKEKNHTKSRLEGALKELLQSLGFDFAQELRATALRMEQFIGQQSLALQQQINDNLMEINSALPISVHEFSHECGMEFESAFASADTKYFAAALTIYKNPKNFFEEGGSREMAGVLEQLLVPLAEEYLKQQETRLGQNLTQGTEAVFQQIRHRFQLRLKESFEADFAALEGGVPVEELYQIKNKLN